MGMAPRGVKSRESYAPQNAAACTLIPTAAFGQSTSTDSQTLQALLHEVRQLRQDVRNVTAASERAQILLSRLQAQQTVIEGAQKELDNARSLLAQAQKHRNEVENEIKSYTDQDTEELTPDSAQRQRIEELVDRFKSNLEKASMEEEKAQTDEMQAKDALQIERAKLDGLQDELDRLYKNLKNLANQPVN